MNSNKSIWLVAYINYDLAHKIIPDLKKKRQYRTIEFVIPTVTILQKKVKGKENYKEVPLLMNYGFFKIPVNWAINLDLLNNIKNDISCISNWVKDRAKVRIKEDDEKYNPFEYDESDVPVATVKEKEISRCIKVAKRLGIFSQAELESLQVGNTIQLNVYPYTGDRAKILQINYLDRKCLVALADPLDETGEVYDMEVEVKFDNILHSIYHGSHDEDYNKEDLLEDYQLNRRKQKTEEDEY